MNAQLCSRVRAIPASRKVYKSGTLHEDCACRCGDRAAPLAASAADGLRSVPAPIPTRTSPSTSTRVCRARAPPGSLRGRRRTYAGRPCAHAAPGAKARPQFPVHRAPLRRGAPRREQLAYARAGSSPRDGYVACAENSGRERRPQRTRGRTPGVRAFRIT